MQLVTARNNFAVAEAQLSQAMGVSVSESYTLSDDQMPPIAGEDGDAVSLVAHAEKNRPEIANLAAQRRAQELTISSVKGAYGPSLSAIANFSDDRRRGRTLWRRTGTSASASPGTSCRGG